MLRDTGKLKHWVLYMKFKTNSMKISSEYWYPPSIVSCPVVSCILISKVGMRLTMSIQLTKWQKELQIMKAYYPREMSLTSKCNSFFVGLDFSYSWAFFYTFGIFLFCYFCLALGLVIHHFVIIPFVESCFVYRIPMYEPYFQYFQFNSIVISKNKRQNWAPGPKISNFI